MAKRDVIVIADSHLGANQGDVNLMEEFLSSLSPPKTELLFLGDLFHIWAGPKKFHTAMVRSFLGFLQDFREKGGVCYLVTGNRDVFFQEKKLAQPGSGLPFDIVATERLELGKEGGKLIAVHGDTINGKDLQYLRWRRLVRHWAFQFPFHLIPASLAKRIMFSLESKLKQTNTAFRYDFPKEEWQQFLASIHETFAPELIIAGHFHPKQPIISTFQNMQGLVIPDWCETLFYLKISEDLSYQTHYYTT